MSLRVITLPFDESNETFVDDVVRRIVGKNKVQSVSDHLFENRGTKYLTLVVRFSDIEQSATSETPSRDAKSDSARRTDEPPKRKPSSKSNGDGASKEVELTGDDLALYERMRKWRFQEAKKNDIPPYKICTNKELELIVKARPAGGDQLRKMEGLSKTRMNRYADQLVQALTRYAG